MQSTEIYPQLPSPEMAVSDQVEGEVSLSPSQSQLMTPPPTSDLQILSNEQEHNMELDATGADGYNNVCMYMSNDFGADALIDQFDYIPTCEELCQTLNNWTDSYTAEQTICSSCGQPFVEGTLWCITCDDADQIIVDDTWTENAEIVDDSNDTSQQLEVFDYSQFLDPSVDVSDIDQKKWVELLESGMFSNTEGGSEEDINKIGHFVCDSNMYAFGSIYPVETSI
ncbi:8938_t:CDS:2 [Paraglomus occultum]|uniref:8938_t:CDS:1 n=1 Tax=Paraglomus occultum TaxID=144539 RepID=A0A9N8VN77_9GLOM|nr:8938_t:CDS:2 [Paraglomus occultum]